MPDILLYLATGVLAGIASGLLGVGGGLIIVPVLYFVFSAQGMPMHHVMHMALATSLATIVVTSISSVIAHQRKQAVLWRVFWRLTPGIVIGAWLGGLLAGRLSTDILRPAFGLFELLVAIVMLSQYKPATHRAHISALKFAIGGVSIGSISALAGIGGGTMTVPFLSWHAVTIKQAVATSAAVGLPIAAIGAAAYIYSSWSLADLPTATLGYVHLTAFAFIVLASFATAPLGAKLAHHLPDRTLKNVFAIFILLVSLKMILD